MKTDASMNSEIQDKENYFSFLDIIRESGQINMFGAAPVLQETYGLSRTEARQVLLEWMDTFAQRHSKNPA